MPPSVLFYPRSFNLMIVNEHHHLGWTFVELPPSNQKSQNCPRPNEIVHASDALIMADLFQRFHAKMAEGTTVLNLSSSEDLLLRTQYCRSKSGVLRELLNSSIVF